MLLLLLILRTSRSSCRTMRLVRDALCRPITHNTLGFYFVFVIIYFTFIWVFFILSGEVFKQLKNTANLKKIHS